MNPSELSVIDVKEANLYRPAPGVQWSVETRGILIFDSRRQSTCLIAYPEAAIWDFTLRGLRMEKMVEQVHWIAGIDDRGARELIIVSLKGWEAAGYLVREDSTNG